MKRMFLVDGSNHAFRVQFALPPRHASSGFPTRVLYGFTLLFQKMLRTYKPDYVVVSFDIGKTFRHEMFPDYKGHRPDMPEDLRQQWPLLPSIVEAFGYTALSIKGYEADDVLGTLATRFASEDMHVYLVTSDKDFAQIVGPHVTLLDERKGLEYGRDEVTEKWGVPPEQVIDLLGLAGDSSDNIPGVEKVGPKTAAKYLKLYDTLDGVIEAAQRGDIKGKTGERLAESGEVARLSRDLATIKLDVPMDVTLESLAPRGIQADAMRALFDEWEFGAVARKLLPGETVDVDVTQGEVVGDLGAIPTGTDPVAVAVDVSDDDPLAPSIRGITWHRAGGRAVYMPWNADTQAALGAWMADPARPKWIHAAKPLYRSFDAHGEGLAGVVGDTRLCDYVLNPHRRNHDIDDLSVRHVGHTLGRKRAADLDEGQGLAVELANVTQLVHAKLEPKLEDGQRWVYSHIELPLSPILSRMEHAGIRLDTDKLAAMDAEIVARLDALKSSVFELAGKEFNLRSRHELRDILFEDLGHTPSKRVKDGWSTDSSVLEKLAANERDVSELPVRILEYRAMDKLRSTYITKLPGWVGTDGRIHSNFRQAVAATGRLASADPNLQNIPVRTAEGRKIRECFVPAEGCVFLSADYSQVELRVLAHFTGDPVLVEGFQAGLDIHRRTASEVFGVPLDDVTSELRSAAKAINFGLLYGMSAFRLAGDLQIPRSEAQQYMKTYFDRMPKVQGWIEQTKEQAHQDGWVETLFGRRRLIPELGSSQFNERAQGEREAVNTRIQGTAADIIKLAMLRVDAALKSEGLATRILLQVHDELLLEVPEGEVAAATALVEREMRAAAELAVPLAVNTSVGTNWNEAHG